MSTLHTLHQFVRTRPRLGIVIVVGVGIACILPASWGLVTRALMGWNVAVWSYLGLMAWLMMRVDHITVRRLACQEDKSAIVVLVVLSIAAVISLAAIVLELTALKQLSPELRLMHYLFTAATVFGSWCLVGVMFTFHYAHMFYRSSAGQRPLRFPDGEKNPDYWDFLYFAFTIAVAVQTSDVTVVTRAMRKTVLAQSILSFLFNAAIFGLSINIAASLIGT
jgi:uncharacterized membrane protein